MIAGANIGGDSDTIASMAGAMAGALAAWIRYQWTLSTCVRKIT